MSTGTPPQTQAQPLICAICKSTESFPSRNKFFKHVKECQRRRDDRAALEAYKFDDNGGLAPYIYVTGGRLRGKTLGTCERFDVVNNRWEVIPSMSENRGSHGAAGILGELYVFGGGGFRSNLATCEKYVAATRTWTHVNYMRSYRHALTVIGISVPRAYFLNTQKCVPVTTSHEECSDEVFSLIFAVGGWIDGSKCVTDNEVYDPIVDEWKDCAENIHPRRLLGGCSYTNPKTGFHALYIFGGDKDYPEKKEQDCKDKNCKKEWFSSEVECYDLAKDEWMRVADMPLDGPASAVQVGPFIYVLVHGKMVLRYDPELDTYATISLLPTPDYYCFDIISISTSIYIMGGIANGKWETSMYKFDVLAESWVVCPSMNVARRRCGAGVLYLDCGREGGLDAVVTSASASASASTPLDLDLELSQLLELELELSQEPKNPTTHIHIHVHRMPNKHTKWYLCTQNERTLQDIKVLRVATNLNTGILIPPITDYYLAVKAICDEENGKRKKGFKLCIVDPDDLKGSVLKYTALPKTPDILLSLHNLNAGKYKGEGNEVFNYLNLRASLSVIDLPSVSSILSKPDNSFVNLGLANNSITSDGLHSLLQNLPSTLELNGLFLSTNIITYPLPSSLINLFSSISTLRSLSLNSNPVSTDVIEQISRVLGTSNIVTLGLTKCNITSVHIHLLVKALVSTSSSSSSQCQCKLEKLFLNFNTIDDIGGTELFNILGKCKLKRLGLAGNLLTDLSAKALRLKLESGERVKTGSERERGGGVERVCVFGNEISKVEVDLLRKFADVVNLEER